MKTQEKSQLKIYIDTSKRDEKEIKLVKTTDASEELLGKKEGSVDVVESIKNLLEENNLNLDDISEFVPNLGPGSFTGLKVGVTISNLLNWLLKKRGFNESRVPEYGGEPNISKRKEKEPIV